MNVPPSEGSEGIVDIFVLSGSSAETRLLEENLAQGGYRVSLFEGSAQLLESLNEGNPNLLICDSTSLGEEGYETCRQIKAGENSWMIPVLVLTRTTGLADLLAILDCNADNFITYPCDPGYFLSFIEGMLSTPVERQTADLIKTQFKIQHDDKVYVVTADRRKLLEFLLSSFETAVTISADLSHVQEESRQLSDNYVKIRQMSAEQGRSLIALNESLKQKEKSEAALSESLAAKGRELGEQENEIARLKSELEDRKKRLTTAEERIRAMEQEHAAVSDGHRANIETLSRQVSELSAELETKITDLENTQHDLEDKAARCANAECTIAELAPQKEEAEKAVHALRLESGKIQAMLAAEQERVRSDEQDLEELQRSKDKTEEEMALAISGLKQAVVVRDEELGRLSRNLEEETIRADHTEERLAALQHEKDDSENALRESAEALKAELQQLQARLDGATAQLEEEDLKRKSVEEELELATAEREKSDERVREVDASLREAESALAEQEVQKSALDRDLATVTAERNRLEADLQSANGELEEQHSLADDERRKKEIAEAGLMDALDEKNRLEVKIRELSSALEETKAAFEAEEEKSASLERDNASLNAKFDQAQESARLASQELDEARSTAGEERRQRGSAEAGLAAAVLEKERFEQEIQAARVEFSEARSAHADSEEQNKVLEEKIAAAHQEQERAAAEHRSALQSLGELQSALELERGRIQALERQLVIVIREKEEGIEAVRSATENHGLELEDKIAELAAVRREMADLLARNGATEDRLRASVLEKEQEAARARTAEGELAKIQATLESEQQLRATVEMGLKSLSQEHERVGSDLRKSSDTWKQRESETSATIQRLNADLKAGISREQVLQQQLAGIIREKNLAEQKLVSLSSELEQARVALADEWEDHMTSNEKLEAASVSSGELQKAEEKLNALTDELQQARSALADEWEDHMTAAERLAEADRKNELLRQSMAPSGAPRSVSRVVALVEKERDLPVTIKPFSLALAKADIPPVHAVHDSDLVKPVNQAGPETSGENRVPAKPDRERSVADLRIEDLFEDEPGEVYSGPVKTHPVKEHSEPVPKIAGNGISVEGTEQEEVIPEEIADADEPAIPDEEETEPEEEQESGESDVVDNDATGDYIPSYGLPSGLSFNRQQWLDLFAWARHAESITPEQRKQIMRMGRLIQRGRKLTRKQDEQVREIITLAQAHGYRLS